MQWQQSYGGSSAEDLHAIQQTSDSGFILGASTRSNDGQVTGSHSVMLDCWVVKVGPTGTLQWQKTFGGTKDELLSTIALTTDGGYIFGAEAKSIDGDVASNLGQSDMWLVKLSTSGTMEWQKSLGGSRRDAPFDILPMSDGGYIVGGVTGSFDGDVTGNHDTLRPLVTVGDFWMLKVGGTPTKVQPSIIAPGLEVWPNPASTELMVSVAEDGVLRLANTLGQEVASYSIKAGKTHVQIDKVPEGVYYGVFVGNSSGAEVRCSVVIRR
jgi:hypothetical protein